MKQASHNGVPRVAVEAICGLRGNCGGTRRASSRRCPVLGLICVAGVITASGSIPNAVMASRVHYRPHPPLSRPKAMRFFTTGRAGSLFPATRQWRGMYCPPVCRESNGADTRQKRKSLVRCTIAAQPALTFCAKTQSAWMGLFLRFSVEEARFRQTLCKVVLKNSGHLSPIGTGPHITGIMTWLGPHSMNQSITPGASQHRWRAARR